MLKCRAVEATICGTVCPCPQGFSDDCSIIVMGDFENTIGDIMKRKLKVVEQWCAENKLKVNPEKTNLILFSRRKNRNQVGLGEIKLFRKVLTLKGSAKYLGVILHSRLTWILHLKDKVDKAIGIFRMCRNGFGRTWGLTPKEFMWIYTDVVRPMLCHGCIVW